MVAASNSMIITTIAFEFISSLLFLRIITFKLFGKRSLETKYYHTTTVIEVESVYYIPYAIVVVMDKALVEPREVFRPAIRAHAKFIILVHNHPSGDPSPSKEDLQLTVKLCMSGEILGINVLDHIIIGFSDHVSFKDKELM